MSRAEWLRTFVAVYRAGSVTAGAHVRGISQPAASQQIAALSRAAGGPVLSRTRDGVGPTARGRELYAQVAESLDRLETVLAGLDGGRLPNAPLPTRIAASADLFEGYVLPRTVDWGSPVTATFGTDGDVLSRLAAGEADVAVTLSAPGRRAAFDTHVVGERRFVLVTAAGSAPPTRLDTAPEIARWLTGRPWVSYSHELPVTRRFWSTYLGRSFDADVRLVAPDLRSVATAVQLGIGVSLIPDYACQRLIAEGSVVEVGDVRDFLSAEPIFGSLRRADTAHLSLRRLLDVLSRHPTG
jgi:DNA-binding transcriptional LysR family regulator